jgi:glutathione S-transferase
VEPLTLYVDDRWTSPYAMSAFVALREKQLPFNVVELSLDRKQTFDPPYRDDALTGRVPALKHGDFWLSESTAIAEYLAETFPFPHHPRLYPSDFKARGRSRQISAWIRSDLLALRHERPTTTIFFPDRRATAPLSEAGEKAAAELLRVADLVIDASRTTLFEDWCIADPDLALMLQRLIANGHAVAPKLRRYAEANWLRPSVREWVEHERSRSP